MRPPETSQLLVDNRHRRRTYSFALVEESSFAQWYPHGSEIIWRHHAELGNILLPGIIGHARHGNRPPRIHS